MALASRTAETTRPDEARLARALQRIACSIDQVERGAEVDALFAGLVTLALRVAVLERGRARGLLPATPGWRRATTWSALRDQIERARGRFAAPEHPCAPLFSAARAPALERAALQLDDDATRELLGAVGDGELGGLHERLLGCALARATTPVLALAASRGREVPVELVALERARAQGEDALLRLLRTRTGRSAATLRRALARRVDARARAIWLRACGGDDALRSRFEWCAGLVRDMTCPVVHINGALYVLENGARRASGSHYTPPALARELVERTLAPLVFRGPARGLTRDLWTLRAPDELLALRVCDAAMGTGALLLGACEYLTARLVESRARALPETPADRGRARLEVAARCLYGVDKDAVAVELARLSLWLETAGGAADEAGDLALGRHLARALRVGDALVGEPVASGASPGDGVGEAAALHWPRAFPEVFGRAPPRGGFDALLANPPFVGGQRITGTLGRAYRDYLVRHVAAGVRGSADLCAYFLLRCCALVREGGRVGVIATNTIAQGDTREVGLDQLVARGYTITGAARSRSWRALRPGRGAASVEVSLLWLSRGTWAGARALDGRAVATITSALGEPGAVRGRPQRLTANLGRSFQGSNILGLGFTMSPAEARALLQRAPLRAAALRPYLNGRDLNRDPEQRASRWVIDFQDWPLCHETAPAGYAGPVAADFPELLARVRTRVQPTRARNQRKARRERWWQFAERAPELYARLRGLARVLVKSEVGEPLAFAFVPNGWVYSHMLVVFPSACHGLFACLQSSLHALWAQRYASSMRADLRYTPTDCFATFPLPPRLDALAELGARYEQRRLELTRARQEGLTRIYKRVHDPDDRAADIEALRSLQVQLDHAVADAYGWSARALDHHVRETSGGSRLWPSAAARAELLDRLLALNHARAEQAQRVSSSASAQACATAGVSSCSVA